jgi:Na+-transporting NADH:ubiquinone oxidoreductase subunit NqrE
MYCITKFLIVLVLVLRFYLRTLHMYSLTVYFELITFPCVILIYVLFMNCIHKLQLYVFYCQGPFCTVLIVILMTSSISILVDLWNTE